ncbi:MAG: DUF3108 domain-containing protein [Rubrivivax sp.]|nr:DUF3108 domain-containing protein [Rubrivivax sp.]
MAAAVLLLHVLLLGRLPYGAGAGDRLDAAPALQVRQLHLAAPAPPDGGLTPDAVAAAAPVAQVRRAPAPTAASGAASAGPAPLSAPGLPVVVADPDEALPPSAGAMPGGTPSPRYATRLPPAATLQYSLQREGPGAAGHAGLQAEMRWRPADAQYTLTLGFGAVGWASVGGLDADGVAPERHVETRRGREVRAANFRREAGPTGGRITFSGPPAVFALLPGAQDRLSWMLQLPAVLEADPTLGQHGSEVRLFVAGVRGDAGWWTFTVVDRGPADLPAGTVADAVHLRREPQRPYDTRVDVWLDPSRHHLPVRVRLDHRGDGGGTDFLLSGFSLP